MPFGMTFKLNHIQLSQVHTAKMLYIPTVSKSSCKFREKNAFEIVFLRGEILLVFMGSLHAAFIACSCTEY